MSKKLTIFFVAMLVTVFAVSSAMAYTLNARSEEMTANSICDFAGTITLEFGVDDYTIINNYLGANDYVLIRVSLSGTDIPPTADVPLLCKDIRRLSDEALTDAEATAAGYLGALGNLLPNAGRLIRLDNAAEVSDVVDGAGGGTDATNDIDAYVYGVSGQQYFIIMITGMQAVTNANVTAGQLPWIKVGLYEDVETLPHPDVAAGAADDGYSTAICADVHDFGGLSKLTVSIDNTPATLNTTTSDNQIGHFLVEDITLRPCDKSELLACSTDSYISLCPITPGGGGQTVACDTYQYCMTAEGDWPVGEDIVIYLRVNGATNGATTQDGVYLNSVGLLDESGDPVPAVVTWYEADGVTEVLDPAGCALVGGAVEFFGPMVARIEVNTAAFYAGGEDELRFCVTYYVDPSEFTAGEFVRLWASAETLPCGSLFSGMMNMAQTVDCGTEPSCIYFPYLVSGIAPWQAGVVLTNVGTDVGPSDMEVTFTLTDVNGTRHQYTKSDFTEVMWAGFLDSIVAEFDGGSIPAGACWMHVEANFAIDGYSFLTDGNFGAGTLPRNLDHCSMTDFK